MKINSEIIYLVRTGLKAEEMLKEESASGVVFNYKVVTFPRLVDELYRDRLSPVGSKCTTPTAGSAI